MNQAERDARLHFQIAQHTMQVWEPEKRPPSGKAILGGIIAGGGTAIFCGVDGCGWAAVFVGAVVGLGVWAYLDHD